MRLRNRVLRRLERSVESRGYPRTAVFLMIAFAALLSFILSIVLTELGLVHMGFRYLLCLGFGYLVFLLLLRALASRHSQDLDPGFDISGSPGTSSSESVAGGGGEFGGGGASGGWGPGSPEAPVASNSSSGTSIADRFDLGFDLDEGWVLVIPVALAVGGLLAGGYVVTIAPILVAEIALDVAVAAGAYRAASRLAPQHWALGAFRRTWFAAFCLAVLVGGLGFLLQALAPDAHTIGAALSSL